VVAGLALVPRSAFAQATVRAEVDAQKIGLQDQLQLTVSVEGSGFRLLEEVAVPKLQNLRVLGGPSISTQVSMVNGAMTQARTSTWILQPLAVGKAEIGPARARLEGGDRASEPIAIEVVAGSVKPARPARPADPFGGDPFEQFFGGRRAQPREPRLFVEAAVSRNRLRVGEPLLLTYWLYTQTSVTDLQFVDAPQYPGFWAEDLERPKTGNQGEGANVGGENYRRFPVFLKLLFPTRAGRLVIPATKLRLGLPRQTFFDSGGVVERESKEVVVTVDPLPEAPGFGGAVGRFKAQASLDKTTLALGEAATLRFKIEGTGNLKWIDKAPEVAVNGAKVYPPQVKSDLKAGASGIAGSRTWEFVVVPQTGGALEVPPLSFAYFDPASGRIETATTPALPLQVEGSAAAAGTPLLPAPAGLPTRSGATLPLRSDLDVPSPLVPPLGPRFLGALVCGVIAAHVALLVAARFGGRRSRRAGAAKAASRSVRAALADLDRVGQDGLTKEASAALIARALHEAFGPLDDPAAEGEGEEAARALLEEVQFVRYAPQLGDYSEKLKELAARASATVRRWA
jgi:hypothetical protein